MAKPATSKGTAAPKGTGTKATSKAVRKAPTKPTAAAPATAKAEAEAERPKAKNTATIKIDKGAGRRGKVDVGLNGRRYTLPVDKEIEVNAGVLGVLRDSNVSFTTISPLAGEDADEGSSASSTLKGTAIRAEEPDPAGPKPDEKPQTLGQGGPGTDKTTEEAAVERDKADAKADA